ncbi:MAG: retropepsin-like aspartic protease [Planctomycetota bacterium]
MAGKMTGRIRALAAICPAGARLAFVTAVTLLAGARATAMDGTGDEMARVGTVAAEVDKLDRVMDRLYRGESVDAARERVNAMVKEHNALVDARNRELDESGAKVDRAREPVEKLRAEIDRMDAALKRKPSASDRAAANEYNALVKRRNAAVKRFNSMNDRVNAVVKTHNAHVKEVKAELKFASGLLDAARGEYDGKRKALERFEESGEDIAFFEAVNRILATVYGEMRAPGADAGWRRLAARLRGIRRELGERAAAEHSQRDHGLVIVEAAVSGEPCWFIVDTGAMRTTFAPGMVDALGLSGKLGDEVELVLAGGMRTKGREITLPRIEVSGADERDVPAAAVKVSDVGVDGLLGQSFLKRFVYTIDESKEAKLILKPRPQK